MTRFYKSVAIILFIVFLLVLGMNLNCAGSTNIFEWTQEFPVSNSQKIHRNSSTVSNYSTYFGGLGDESSGSMVLDSAGNIVLAGRTDSVNFPTVNAYQNASAGHYDIFVAKFSADGQTLLFSTLLGGSGVDSCWDITVDSADNIVIAGSTSSLNFPTVNAYQNTTGGEYDAFVAKFSADGQNLLFSTYLGGSGDDWSNGVTIDANGNIIVTGSTNSNDFPTMNAYQGNNNSRVDIFVVKLSADGQTLQFSTYLGGNGNDWSNGVITDANGNIIINGGTNSSDFPTLNAYQTSHSGGEIDAFITKLRVDGQALLFSTYLGGNGRDYGISVDVNATGNIAIVGETISSDFPTTGNVFQNTSGGACDVFVMEFSNDGQTLLFSTYLGGSLHDSGYEIMFDGSTIIVTGPTDSRDFPVVNGSQRYHGGGSRDAFVAKFSANGRKLIFSTYLGGTGEEIGDAIAIDATGTIIIVGETTSSDFPTLNAYQDSHGGGQDIYLRNCDFIGSYTNIEPSESTTPIPSPGFEQFIVVFGLAIIVIAIRKREKLVISK
ncbi:MAG: SBBP repeat-containing protein [Candidatus Hermodarchaeota archaeon]